MLTAPRTPSSALTVTGESTVTPTAPSVTDAVSLGTSRSPNGVPLSSLVWGGGGGAGGPLHALTRSPTAGTITTAPSQLRIRRGRVADWACDMLIHLPD